MAKLSFLIPLLMTTFVLSNSQKIIYYFQAQDGGILTAHPETPGLPGLYPTPGEVYSEEAQLGSDGNLILAQQWTYNNQGHGDIYLLAQNNTYNEVYNYLDTPESFPGVKIWYFNYAGPAPETYYLKDPYRPACLVHNGIGQRVNVTGTCREAALTDVWTRVSNVSQLISRPSRIN